MDVDDFLVWGSMVIGLFMINIFPSIISWEWSGLVLGLGIVLFVEAVFFKYH